MSFQVSRTSRMAACVIAAFSLPSIAQGQIALPEIVVTSPNPIARSSTGTTASGDNLQGTLPVVTDQFATVTVVPNDELRRNGGGDARRPVCSRSPASPDRASRPAHRAGRSSAASTSTASASRKTASAPTARRTWAKITSCRSIPLTADQVEVIRGPATLRFGSQAIGGVVETTNNRIPTAIPRARHRRRVARRRRRRSTTASTARCCSMPAAATSRSTPMRSAARPATTACRSYPYLVPPDPAMRRTRRSPAPSTAGSRIRALRSDGQSVGGSYIFNDGFLGVAVTQNNALYHIPGIDGENTTRASTRSRPRS